MFDAEILFKKFIFSLAINTGYDNISIKRAGKQQATEDDMIISSQRFTDAEIVAEKIEAEDFEVLVSPVFRVGGEDFMVILDGHHSYAAAKAAGVEPCFVTADCSQHDAVALLDRGLVDDFMLAVHLGDNYYDVETGRDVW